MSTIRIIFADLNKNELVMYREDGSMITIYQGDKRIAAVVAKVFPDMEKQQFCDLPEEMLEVQNHYNETEKKMNGFVRFFKVIKTKFDEIIGKHAETVPVLNPQTAGNVELLNKTINPAIASSKVVDQGNKPLTKSEAAVADIMANSVPASHKSFTDADINGQETTTVAVLADGTVIENAQKLETQFKALNAGTSTGEGMKNFLNRMASVKRAHSAQDLLTFMEKGELPIADDGSVLVYKLLRKTPEDGVYVDCHSGKVKQKLGSHVFMDEKLVDPNRSNECSNGLHVARRDYLHSFGGNVCVLAKLAPEDVIAVPHGDARKLRAKGYHIISVLSEEDRSNVVGNRPLKDSNLLGNAVAGNHVGILQTVQITQSSGGGVIYKDVQALREYAVDESLKAESLDHLKKDEESSVDAVALAKGQLYKAEPAGPVSEPLGEAQPVPAPVFTPVAETKAKPVTVLDTLVSAYKASEPGSLDEHIAATALVGYKKASKKSWTALGVPVHIFDAASTLASQPQPVPVPVPWVDVSRSKNQCKPVKKPAERTPPKGKAGRVSSTGPLTNAAGKPMGKPAETVQMLVVRAVKNKSQVLALQAFDAKKAKKKSWDALGVAPSDVVTLTKLAGK